jgi:glycosyltransferase involved in cell wall biosynthesis
MFLTIKNNENIISVGYQEDVRPFFAISDVFVLPSYREGFPNSVLQAGAMDLPSIVTNISGCNEIIDNNVNGILVPPKNAEELEIVMHNLIINKYLTIRMKENARKMVIDNFDKDIVWNALIKEYYRIFQNAHR